MIELLWFYLILCAATSVTSTFTVGRPIKKAIVEAELEPYLIHTLMLMVICFLLAPLMLGLVLEGPPQELLDRIVENMKDD